MSRRRDRYPGRPVMERGTGMLCDVCGTFIGGGVALAVEIVPEDPYARGDQPWGTAYVCRACVGMAHCEMAVDGGEE